ncbi:hypothetical protein [Nonomuraea sp. NPDC049625]|uniref:hypothetical protein n=1 Tax=Nonomuraea sp. NPDC049625 TaxID=3155775 RepID=UPI003419F343
MAVVLCGGSSARIDENGRLVSWSRWRAGQQQMLRWEASSRRINRLPLPASPNVTAVLADAFGPTGDPVEHGYRKVDDHSYEIEEGLGVFRLSFPTTSTGVLSRPLTRSTGR